MIKIILYLSLMLTSLSNNIMAVSRFDIKNKFFPKLGIYVTDIYDFDYNKNFFHISGYLWVTYNSNKYQPGESLEIINASTFENKISHTDVRKDNSILFGQRFFATIFHQWDMRDFPFDQQELSIKIEDGWYSNNILEFGVDEENSGVYEEATILGWEVKDFSIDSSPNTYNSNFGESNNYTNTFSRVAAKITIQRDWGRPFINYFINFFIAIFLSILAILLNPVEIGSKFSLTLASIFAVVGNKYILDTILPVTIGYSLVDKIELATFIFMLFTILFNAYEIGLHVKNRDAVRRKIVLYFLPIIVFLYMFYVVYSIVSI